MDKPSALALRIREALLTREWRSTHDCALVIEDVLRAEIAPLVEALREIANADVTEAFWRQRVAHLRSVARAALARVEGGAR